VVQVQEGFRVIKVCKDGKALVTKVFKVDKDFKDFKVVKDGKD